MTSEISADIFQDVCDLVDNDVSLLETPPDADYALLVRKDEPVDYATRDDLKLYKISRSDDGIVLRKIVPKSYSCAKTFLRDEIICRRFEDLKFDTIDDQVEEIESNGGQWVLRRNNDMLVEWIDDLETIQKNLQQVSDSETRNWLWTWK